MRIEDLSDEELVARAQSGGGDAQACLDTLYRRFYPRVAHWCLRVCGDRERATDLAQEVFLRVHERLDGFRGDSRFSTWLYTVTRRLAINHGMAARRRQGREQELDAGEAPEPEDEQPDAHDEVERGERAAWVRRAMAEVLEPLEARVLYLHFVNGLTLDGVTELLGLRNKSGAKAYIVSGKRKLKRRYGDAGPFPAAGAGRTGE